MHFIEWNNIIPIQISLKFVPRSPIDNKPAWVQVMAWHWTCDKHYLNQCWSHSLTLICGTRGGAWVKGCKELLLVMYKIVCQVKKNTIYHLNFSYFIHWGNIQKYWLKSYSVFVCLPSVTILLFIYSSIALSSKKYISDFIFFSIKNTILHLKMYMLWFIIFYPMWRAWICGMSLRMNDLTNYQLVFLLTLLIT